MSDKDPAGRLREPDPESVLHSAVAHRDSKAASKTKTAKIDVRFTQDERDAIVLQVKAFGVTPSAFVHAVALDALDGRGAHVRRMVLAASAAPDPAQAAAVEQMRRVGVNLNQALRLGRAVDNEMLRSILAAQNEMRGCFGDRTAL